MSVGVELSYLTMSTLKANDIIKGVKADAVATEREACAQEIWKARRHGCELTCSCALCLTLQHAAACIRARAIVDYNQEH